MIKKYDILFEKKIIYLDAFENKFKFSPISRSFLAFLLEDESPAKFEHHFATS